MLIIRLFETNIVYTSLYQSINQGSRSKDCSPRPAVHPIIKTVLEIGNYSSNPNLLLGRLFSHTCHIEIDETRIFVGNYTIVETWCDRQKTASFA